MSKRNLAFKNIKRHIKDYSIYFLSLSFAVALMYAFNAAFDQKAFELLIKDISHDFFTGIRFSMILLTIIINLILGVMILYAKRFLLMRRSQELGIYLLLGMRKKKLLELISYENNIVAILSFLTGLPLGVVLSQLVSIINLKLFSIDILEFRPLFSWPAAISTFLAYSLLSLPIGHLSRASLLRMKLADLFSALRKNETMNLSTKTYKYFVFPLSLLLIAQSFVYNLRYVQFKEFLTGGFFGFILFVVGIFLFYLSISSILRDYAKSKRKYYYKGINLFFINRLSKKIKSNALVMTLIAVLMITILPFSLAEFSFFGLIDAGIEEGDPACDMNISVDIMSYERQHVPPFFRRFAGEQKKIYSSIADELSDLNIDLADYASEIVESGIYKTDIAYTEIFSEYLKSDENLAIRMAVEGENFKMMSIADFNRLLQLQGKKPLHLEENGYYFCSNSQQLIDLYDHLAVSGYEFKIGDTLLKPASEKALNFTYLMSQKGQDDYGTLIVPERLTKQLTKSHEFLSLKLKADVDNKALARKLDSELSSDFTVVEVETRLLKKAGLRNVFLISAIYTTSILLMVMLAVLALKQASEVYDARGDYLLLFKLGVEKEEIYKCLFKQNLIFFCLPLLIALPSTFIQFCILFKDSFNLWPAGLIFSLLLYVVYFVISYVNSKSIISAKLKKIN